MSQALQASQEEGSRHWLDNMLPLLTEARGMFAGDEEINKVFEVSENLQKMDQARTNELDALREKLRGNLLDLPNVAVYSPTELTWFCLSLVQLTRVKPKAINTQPRDLQTHYQRNSTRQSW